MPQQPLIGERPGVSICFHGTDVGVILRPIKYGFKGIDANTFHTLPNARLITAPPRVGGKRLPFEKYSTCLSEWKSTSSLVFYAEAVRPDRAAPRQRFALKVAFHVEEPSSGGGQLKDGFRKEALTYRWHLSKIQGVAVPKHYGVWYGRTSWGATVACAIMEWGGHPYDCRVVDPQLTRPDRRTKVMQALKAVHDAGLQHNNLIPDTSLHFLYDLVEEKASIVDFSNAEKHKCMLRMEMKAYTTPPLPHIFGCDELWDLATTIGFFGQGPFDGPNADPEVLAMYAAVARQDQEKMVRRKEQQRPSGGAKDQRGGSEKENAVAS
ncbi:hypothetical protein BD626DRAFT_426999 [Schizophyllum amplum]|uniref:Protein kinase domain-containing protein n=1 Tax=Schizophyllum amplum TaxID=97359 RepID=A0A550CQV4_9AGAR|nr:hypothetical protein BD626DRAFT_426999 [Auriculariopsis ampla]